MVSDAKRKGTGRHWIHQGSGSQKGDRLTRHRGYLEDMSKFIWNLFDRMTLDAVVDRVMRAMHGRELVPISGAQLTVEFFREKIWTKRKLCCKSLFKSGKKLGLNAAQ